MLYKGAIAVGAALVLSSFLVVTDASARRGGGGGHGARSHAVKAGGKTGPVVHSSSSGSVTAKSGAKSRFRPTKSGPSDYSLSGPFVGVKYNRNVP